MDTALPSISPAELIPRLGRADAPLLLDVRRRARFDPATSLLPGARYCAPEDVAAFARREAPREVVVYCVYGHEVSHGATQLLRDAGWNARYLQGGIEGGEAGVDRLEDIGRWRGTPLPRMAKRPDLGVTGERPSRWITRARPKIDRIACPWLILRFIDPRAQFFYAPADEVFAQAKKLDAIPFDIENAPISHVWERCSFDALLQAFDLRLPALDALAAIVRGADTSRLDLTAQSGGLLALSLGLSRLHADDHAMLQAALPLYDALYAWCREGRGETHSWTAHAAAAA
ncbi:chromate resistance protein ChrB domain-containing protein [Ramlibacter pallidus]|uniref:Chromate resistance protein n=1 Tax=Ramlibacter pallidus TaxID=2780087 RepID=A0ABR9S1T4_9BURK|nr:chromate resistance protein ChrB domain-containing protein [Ramlibacter pallidus]MBE7367482.1 chromate resistance protein [Ramlibacter pallidus]